MFKIILLENRKMPSEIDRLKNILNSDVDINFEVESEPSVLGLLSNIQVNDYDCILLNNTWTESEFNSILNSEQFNNYIAPLCVLLQYTNDHNDFSENFKSEQCFQVSNKTDVAFKEWITENIGKNQLINNIQQEGITEASPFGEESQGFKPDHKKYKTQLKKSIALSFVIFIITALFLMFYFEEMRLKKEDENLSIWKHNFQYVESDLAHKFKLVQSLNSYFKLSKTVENKSFTQFTSSILRNQPGITSFDHYNQKGELLFNYPWGNKLNDSKINDPTFFQEIKISALHQSKDLTEGIMISVPHTVIKKNKGFFATRISYEDIIKPLFYRSSIDKYSEINIYLNDKKTFTKINSIPQNKTTKARSLGTLAAGNDVVLVTIKLEKEALNIPYLLTLTTGFSLICFAGIYLPLRSKEKNIIELNYQTRLRTHQISRYKRIFHVSQDALIVLGEHDRIILSNDASQRMFGYTQEVMAEKTISDLFPKLKRTNFLIHFSKNFRNSDGKRYKVRELDGVRANGDVIPCSVSTSRFKYLLWDQYIVIIRDISETVLFRKNLMVKNEQLTQLDKSKNVFLSNVSHELRTPLTAIMSSSNMIARTLHHKSRSAEYIISEKFNEIIRSGKINNTDIPSIEKVTKSIDNFIPIINKEAKRLLDMVNEILDLAKIEAGKMELQYNFIDINNVINRAYDSFKGMCEEKERIFEKQNIKNGQYVFADEDRLLQVLQNLLNNAIKFSEKGDSISIILSQDENRFRIGIKDSGIGISEEHQKSIFNRFQQVQSVQKGKPKGTGLGLSISKHILKKHGSFLELESIPREGSEFFFHIPIQLPKQHEAVEYFNKRVISHA